jgi:hypothetical protein
MGKIIIPNVVQRRPGYIYYIDGKGNVCEAVSAVGKGRKAKKKPVKKAPTKSKTKPAKKTVKKK